MLYSSMGSNLIRTIVWPLPCRPDTRIELQLEGLPASQRNDSKDLAFGAKRYMNPCLSKQPVNTRDSVQIPDSLICS